MNKSLSHYLIEVKTELKVRKKKLQAFTQEVAVNNIIYAISETLEKLKGKK